MNLWEYCAGCGKRIEVGDICCTAKYSEYEGQTEELCFCKDCFKVDEKVGMESDKSLA